MSSWTALAAKTLMIGLPGPELDGGTRERIVNLGPGGAILFGRNLDTPEQTRRLLSEFRELLSGPALLALDQEGGRVSRLEPWIGATPTATALTRAGDAATRRFARATAAALGALGFNLDFAPVVDLCPEHATNGIGNRSFGVAPGSVTLIAGAFLDALQGAGVAGCLKHFPGLGPTDVDSHETLPTSLRSRSELESSDLVPYVKLTARAACVMVGHGHYPALDPTPGLPATLSRPIVSDLLRAKLGFEGLVVSDDLEMGAVAPLDQDGDAAVQAIEAGCDLLLYCSNLDLAEAAARALATRARADPAFGRRLADAADSVGRVCRRWALPAGRDTDWADARLELVEASALA